MKKNTFHQRLRELRIDAKKSMGHVARAIGVTTVYYSEVENGKKLPFPPHKADYRLLAEAVNGNREELEVLAAAGRLSQGVSIKTNQRTHNFAVMLARRLNDDSLEPDQLEEIERILEKKAGK